MNITAVIFDLDGVVVSTDEYHYKAWKRLADEEGIIFTREDNEDLRGVSRMDSLEIILKKSSRIYTFGEKETLCARKNEYYKESLCNLSPQDILPGAISLLKELRKRGAALAIGSSSKNASLIIEKIGLGDSFDAMSDGNMIRNSKPHPEVFLLAAKLLKKNPDQCIVVEDAAAGVEAAINAGMKTLGVGSAQHDSRVTISAPDLTGVTADMLLFC